MRRFANLTKATCVFTATAFLLAACAGAGTNNKAPDAQKTLATASPQIEATNGAVATATLHATQEAATALPTRIEAPKATATSSLELTATTGTLPESVYEKDGVKTLIKVDGSTTSYELTGKDVLPKITIDAANDKDNPEATRAVLRDPVEFSRAMRTELAKVYVTQQAALGKTVSVEQALAKIDGGSFDLYLPEIAIMDDGNRNPAFPVQQIMMVPKQVDLRKGLEMRYTKGSADAYPSGVKPYEVFHDGNKEISFSARTNQGGKLTLEVRSNLSGTTNADNASFSTMSFIRRAMGMIRDINNLNKKNTGGQVVFIDDWTNPKSKAVLSYAGRATSDTKDIIDNIVGIYYSMQSDFSKLSDPSFFDNTPITRPDKSLPLND